MNPHTEHEKPFNAINGVDETNRIMNLALAWKSVKVFHAGCKLAGDILISDDASTKLLDMDTAHWSGLLVWYWYGYQPADQDYWSRPDHPKIVKTPPAISRYDGGHASLLIEAWLSNLHQLTPFVKMLFRKNFDDADNATRNIKPLVSLVSSVYKVWTHSWSLI